MVLAERIRAIERRWGGARGRAGSEAVARFIAANEAGESPLVSTDGDGVDAALFGGGARAGLHEWFGVGSPEDRERDARREAWTPALLPLVHLTRRWLSDHGFAHRVVWIGRRCFPHGAALIGADGDARLLERSLFVSAERPADRLWAIDLALRCGAVGVVAADGSGLDMAATRRIQLVAGNHGTPALLVRPPWERDELSAAQTRWVVRWGEGTEARRHEGTKASRCTSGHEGTEGNQNRDPDSIGRAVTAKFEVQSSKFEERERESEMNPRWSVELLRCKGVSLDGRRRVWSLEWDRGEGVVHLSAALAGATGDAGDSTGERRRLRQA